MDAYLQCQACRTKEIVSHIQKNNNNCFQVKLSVHVMRNIRIKEEICELAFIQNHVVMDVYQMPIF